MEDMVERDRDATGRALNARPRDRFGRPLPPGSQGVPRIPDDLNLPPQQTLAFAQQLLDDGLAFNAHEVLEAAWKNGPFAERMLWQGLAQYAVGLTHIQRGNTKGAYTLLDRAINRLTTFEADFESDPDYTETAGETTRPFPYDVNAAGLIAHARGLLADLEAGLPIPEDRLMPRLCATTSRPG